MRLHRLTVRDVKGIRERTIDFPDSGVVVIEGPNEVGKSTLLEAFDRLLDPRAKAGSQSKAVRALQPVGRDVGPYVEAEFSVGGQRLRFAKRWLRDPITTLDMLSPAPAQLVGADAQERLDEILTQSLDRPLWDALRFAQAGELGQVPLTGSDVLTEALDGASGADLHAADGTELLDLVEQEYLRYYTPTGRVTGELRTAVAGAHAARDEAVHAHGSLTATAQLLTRHRDLVQRQQQLDGIRPGLAERVDAAQAKVERASSYESAHQRAADQLAQARERSVRAGQDRAARGRLVRDVETAAEQVRVAQQALERASQAAERAGAEVAPLTDAAAAAREALDSARDVADRASSDAAHLAEVERIELLSGRCEQLQALTRERAEAADRLGGLLVTAEVLDGVVQASQELAVLRARHETASPLLTVRGLGAASVQVSGETIDLAAGDLQRRVTDELVLELPGALRVTLVPESGALARAEQIERAQASLSTLLATIGVAGVDEARLAATQRAEVAAQVRRLDDRLADLAGPGGLETMQGELSVARESAAAYRRERDADLALPADAEQARAVARAARVALERAKAASTQADAAARSVTSQVAQASRALEQAATALAVQQEAERSAGERLAAAREAITDERLDELVGQRSGEFAQVEATEAVARRELKDADAETARRELTRAQAALTEHDETAAQVREDLLVLQGQVEMTSGEGRQEVYDLALAAYLDARQHLETVERRARAARQLHRTLVRHRDSAHRAYVRPYATQLERLGKMVYGESFGVDVAPDLTIAGRHLDGTTVPFEQLSGGAKEQLGILARLAVAALVDTEQGVPVIIDDALGYTDPDRLHRVGTVFSGPAETTQVILLTCTPERYAGLGHAHTIRLTA